MTKATSGTSKYIKGDITNSPGTTSETSWGTLSETTYPRDSARGIMRDVEGHTLVLGTVWGTLQISREVIPRDNPNTREGHVANEGISKGPIFHPRDTQGTE